MTNVICAPRSTYSSGRMAAIIPMPTKLNEPSATNTAAVGMFMLAGSSCGKNSTITASTTSVCTRP
jgi:hypothetical protein